MCQRYLFVLLLQYGVDAEVLRAGKRGKLGGHFEVTHEVQRGVFHHKMEVR